MVSASLFAIVISLLHSTSPASRSIGVLVLCSIRQNTYHWGKPIAYVCCTCMWAFNIVSLWKFSLILLYSMPLGHNEPVHVVHIVYDLHSGSHWFYKVQHLWSDKYFVHFFREIERHRTVEHQSSVSWTAQLRESFSVFIFFAALLVAIFIAYLSVFRRDSDALKRVPTMSYHMTDEESFNSTRIDRSHYYTPLAMS